MLLMTMVPTVSFQKQNEHASILTHSAPRNRIPNAFVMLVFLLIHMEAESLGISDHFSSLRLGIYRIKSWNVLFIDKRSIIKETMQECKARNCCTFDD